MGGIVQSCGGGWGLHGPEGRPGGSISQREGVGGGMVQREGVGGMRWGMDQKEGVWGKGGCGGVVHGEGMRGRVGGGGMVHREGVCVLGGQQHP